MTETTTKNNKSLTKKVFALGTLGLIGSTMLTAAYAADDDSNTVDVNAERPESFMQNEEIKAAIDAGDYETFIELASEYNENIENIITEERFVKLLEQKAIHDAIQDAVLNNDYDAWVEAMQSLPNGEAITELIEESDFTYLVEMHELRSAGEHEEAREIAQDLGLTELHEEAREERREVRERIAEEKGVDVEDLEPKQKRGILNRLFRR